jgi:hypothetical protein
MSPQSLGTITVATGTPVPLTSTPHRCARIRFESAGTGKTFVCTKSGAVIATLPSAGSAWEIASRTDSDLLNLTDFALNADANGDGVTITYFVA